MYFYRLLAPKLLLSFKVLSDYGITTSKVILMTVLNLFYFPVLNLSLAFDIFHNNKES